MATFAESASAVVFPNGGVLNGDGTHTASVHDGCHNRRSSFGGNVLSVGIYAIRMERQRETGHMESQPTVACRTLFLNHHATVPKYVDNGTMT